MFNFSNISYKNKLVLIQLLTAVISIVLCSVLFAYTIKKNFDKYEEQSLQSISKVMGENLKTNLEFVTFDDEAEQELKSFKINKDIVNAAVLDSFGRVHASYTVDSIKHPVNFDATLVDRTIDFNILKSPHELKVYYNIHNPDGFLGTLCIKVKQNKDVWIKQALFNAGLVLILGALIAFVLATFFQRSISGPLLDLVSAMRRVSEKQDYSLRASVQGNDEIAELGDVFNDMLVQIDKRNESLKEARDLLELRVSNRTQELRKKTSELENSNRELEQFAYVASHDLQEPLRMIGSFTQLIERRYENTVDPELREYMKFIVDGVSRMQSLIKDLLKFSRVGTVKMAFATLDFDDIMLKCLSNLRYSIEENNAKIEFGELPVIRGDEVKLLQLFQNLIVNAIKFRSEKTPVILIRGEEREDDWLFSIEDNGIGIESQFKDRIFMIFQRLHDSSYAGTGIGLAICKKIVELHGGDIWFQSELGNGTTFYFTIKKEQERVLEAIRQSEYNITTSKFN